MLGAIVGDIAGSRFEFSPVPASEDFEFFHPQSRFTDDTVLTLATALSLMQSWKTEEELKAIASKSFKEFTRRYPGRGYGLRFLRWAESEETRPYGSKGNGSAMRISPVGWFSETEEEVRTLSRVVTEVTHNTEEAIKGAEAIAMCIFLARKGRSKAEIKEFVVNNYWQLDFTISERREEYRNKARSHSPLCNPVCAEAIVAFLEGDSFEKAVRNAVILGGDADTRGAMAASIAEAFYGIGEYYRKKALGYLDEYLQNIAVIFEKKYGRG